MNRYAFALLVAVCCGYAAPAGAQQPVAPPPIIQLQDADQTRAELQELLRQHPPSVAQVLRADPSLATPDYLGPYPALLEFIKQHPEVTRNPAYFFGSIDFRQQLPRDRASETFEQVME